MFSTRLPGVVHFNTTRVCMGEAAGTAASLARETGVAVADVDTDALRATFVSAFPAFRHISPA